MSNELTNKAKSVRDSLLLVRQETESVLADKGISTPTNGVPVTQIPEYIKSIWSQDFEFLMNFQLIDQVGDPSIPQTGQSWKDSGIEQEIPMEDDMTSTPLITMSFDPDPYTIDSVPNLIGWVPSVESNITQELTVDDTVLIDFAFETLEQVPQELIAPEENTNLVS